MMYFLLVVVLSGFYSSLGYAATPLTENDTRLIKGVIRGGDTLPNNPSLDMLFLLKTDATGQTCTQGGGTTRTLCRWDGVGWVALSSAATAQGLDANFDVVRRIDGATSATPLTVGNGTKEVEMFGDNTKGFVLRPNPLGDVLWSVWTNFNGCFYDEEAASTFLCFDPDAPAMKDKYLFTAGYRPLKSIWIDAGALDGDGTNCAANSSAVTINSGPKIQTIICTDNNSSRLNGKVLMPNDWDGGTITFTQVVIQTAADTNALNGDVAAQCRGTGETPSSTYGTEVALDITNVGGSNKNDMVTSAAVTPAGTCAANDMLYFYYDVDATGTTTAMATLHILGFRITYTSTSLSQ